MGNLSFIKMITLLFKRPLYKSDVILRKIFAAYPIKDLDAEYLKTLATL